MNSEPVRVGLTGGIGSGKSTACQIFMELGVPVIDADSIAHKLTEPGQPVIQQIKEIFGPEACTTTGTLDRVWLRQQVFNNTELRHKLEKLLHPLVYAEINHQIESLNTPYCIVAIPLLIETQAQKRVHRILVIDVPESVQIDRARQRDHTNAADIQKIMASQASRAQRLGVADDIIHNDGNIESLRQQIHRLHEQYLQLASATKHSVN